MGVGTAAAPLAAKAALDESIANQSGINLLRATGAFAVNSGGVPVEAGSNTSYQQRYIGVAEYVKMFGIPEVIENTYRRNTQYVHALDPDIACKKSWSMSVKIQEQRERNYRRMVEGIGYNAWYYKNKSIVEKVLGFEWPW